MKIFKHKNIMGLIYSVVLAIPLLSILVRSSYVVVNKNAKDSYSGLNDNNINLKPVEEFIVDNKYNIQTHNNTNTNGLSESLNYIMASTLIINDSVYTNIRIGFYRVDDTLPTYIYLREVDNNNNLIFDGDVSQTSTTLNINFIFESITSNFDESLYQYFNYVIYDSNYYLDNAFDYSLTEYVDENSFGKLNFFEWFFDIFMYSNQKNNLYIRFVNWYMNYVLLVSSSYILFLVLMWFINYSRRILERGLDYDW